MGRRATAAANRRLRAPHQEWRRCSHSEASASAVSPWQRRDRDRLRKRVWHLWRLIAFAGQRGSPDRNLTCDLEVQRLLAIEEVEAYFRKYGSSINCDFAGEGRYERVSARREDSKDVPSLEAQLLPPGHVGESARVAPQRAITTHGMIILQTAYLPTVRQHWGVAPSSTVAGSSSLNTSS